MAREPGRCGRKEGVGRESHQREDHDHGDVAAEEASGGEPEEPGHEIGRDEVAQVDDTDGVVVPVQVSRAVPKAFLEPDRRNAAEEQDLLDPKLRAHVRRKEQVVGMPSQEVIRRKDESERKPPRTTPRNQPRTFVNEKASSPRTIQTRMWPRESVTPSLMTMTESATPYADGPTQGRLRRTRPGSYSRSATETTEEPFTGCTVTSRS